jgi:DNA-binding NtrC family response regulator
VTRDAVFLSHLGLAAAACGWTIRHTSSFVDAAAMLRCGSIPLVVYDRDLTEHDWETVLPQLNAVAPHLCILLASRVADEYLRQAVVRHRGYDILIKSATPEDLTRRLQFAWFWNSRLQKQCAAVGGGTAA